MTGFISCIMSGLACWKLLSVQSFPASRHFTVVKITAQEICVTLSKSHGLQCRELSFFPIFNPSAFLSTNTPGSSAHRHIPGSLPGQTGSQSQEGQGLCDSRTGDQFFGDVCKSVTIITLRYAQELCSRQRNNWIQILMCRHPPPPAPGIAGKLPGLTRKSPSWFLERVNMPSRLSCSWISPWEPYQTEVKAAWVWTLIFPRIDWFYIPEQVAGWGGMGVGG